MVSAKFSLIPIYILTDYIRILIEADTDAVYTDTDMIVWHQQMAEWGLMQSGLGPCGVESNQGGSGKI